MPLTDQFFRTFTTKDLADASTTTEAIVGLEVRAGTRVRDCI
jgi:predicted lactoylglutathione lyase